MVGVDIRGVEVDFPFTPYPCQIDYMSSVIECLQEEKNGILESPTGTGKTLCLLCACLAWRQNYVAQAQMQQRLYLQEAERDSQEASFKEHVSDDIAHAVFGSSGKSSKDMMFRVPKIIYSSRTHSQLSQVVNELKHTVYRPKICILASREQMCIHPEVTKLESNTAKIHACRAKVNARTCHFYNNVEGKKDDASFSESILDIEELVELGEKHKACPYYLARELRSNADIVFMPYNYLIDFKSRQANNIDMKNSIVICDEAHNLEKICEDTASFDLSSADIANCIEEVDKLIAILQKVKGATDDRYDYNPTLDTDLDVEDLATLKALFLSLEETIGNVDLPNSGSGVTKPGRYIYELFKQLNISFETKHLFISVLEKCINATTDTRIRVRCYGLEKMLDILSLLFGTNQLNLSHDVGFDSGRYYKVHIRSDNNLRKWQGPRTDPWASAKKVAKEGRILSYWCFSPSYSMKELVGQGVRSVILTSGTLCPIESLIAEFQVKFPVELQNPHVISKNQIWIGVVSKGPCGSVLNSSYKNRSSIEYLSSLGNTIVNFARIIPDGVLVFFPSYPVMFSCIEHWQSSGVWDRICQHKSLHVEPQNKSEFVRVMDQYYSCIMDEESNGAMFFGVCRGKVSEGVDFADINGRAVIITGLPYPPSKEAKVMLKMQYLDENIGFGEQKSICGRDWYRQQASRAVNQAIGRVIRHRKDYGAIILCDERFAQKDSRNQLPKWLRGYIQICASFGIIQKSLKDFFSEASSFTGDVALDKASLKQAGERRVTRPFKKPASTSEKNAKDVVLHVASLKPQDSRKHDINKIDEDSVNAASQKPINLLDSLSQSDKNSFICESKSRQINESLSSTIQNKHIDVDTRISATQIAKKTHKVTLRKRNTITNSREDKATAYLRKVRQSLSANSFDQLKTLLTSFKKEHDLDVLIEGIFEIFNDASMHDLIEEFVQFIPSHLKREFEINIKERIGS